MLIHEAGVYGQYPGTHVAPDPQGKIYRTALPLAGEAAGEGGIISAPPLPWIMPWRVFIVGGLNTIVESNLVQALNEPSAIGDDRWVKPGIASFSWLTSGSQNPAVLRSFIDLSSRMGWAYSLIDADWERISPTSMEDLTAYARAKNVRLIFWYNSGGANNNVTESPRNIINDTVLREAEFARIERLGVAGIKVDFWHSDKQILMQRYVDVLRDAARHKLLVNFYGSTVQRGWKRTYPNLVSMEAVSCEETYSSRSRPAMPTSHRRKTRSSRSARNAVGPMDATPIVFSNSTSPHKTTKAHEAALGVRFRSGVQHPG